jgi:GNAT superfamily N-acetyltransferase
LYELFVPTIFRGQGIGAVVIHAVEELAKSEDFEKIKSLGIATRA